VSKQRDNDWRGAVQRGIAIEPSHGCKRGGYLRAKKRAAQEGGPFR